MDWQRRLTQMPLSAASAIRERSFAAAPFSMECRIRGTSDIEPASQPVTAYLGSFGRNGYLGRDGGQCKSWTQARMRRAAELQTLLILR